MDARLLLWIWCLSSILNFIEPTTSVSFTQNDYERKATENFKPAKPTDRFERFAATYPIDNNYYNEPTIIKNRRRSYRQADSEAINTMESTTMTESNTPDEQSNSTPSSSTVAYDSSTTELVETKETEKVIPLTTERRDWPSVFEVKKLYSNKTTYQPKVNKNNDIEFSDLNGTTEPITLSTQASDSVDNVETVETPNQLAVVGISETDKHTERIMTLQPSKEEKYVWLKESIHNLLEATTLKRETEDYVIQLHRRYNHLPVAEADNSIWTKYSRAVVESFVLDFCRNYPRYTASEQWIARWYKMEEYKTLYNTTLLHLQQKKYLTAVQFAAPVRSAADIYKAILDTPIGIVQSKCVAQMQHWMCDAEYIVRLAEISETCEHIWYHAQVHLTVLQSIRQAKGAKNPADEVIDELDSRLSIEPNNDVIFLFDFIVKTLGDLVEKLKEPLLAQASLYSLVRKLQREDKLNCLNIDEQEW